MRKWIDKLIWLTGIVVEQKKVAVKTFLTEELRNEFKAFCAKEGKNMSDVLAEYVEGYVKRREKRLFSNKQKESESEGD